MTVEPKGQPRRKITRRAFAVGAAGCLAGSYPLCRYFDLFNHAPEADFTYQLSGNTSDPALELATHDRTLKYIAANSGEDVLFYNATTNPDKDALTCVLFLDDQPVANTIRTFDQSDAPIIYSAKLTAGEHTARLEVTERERIATFLDASKDPDAAWPSPLREMLGIATNQNYTWFLDGKEVNTTSRYSQRLPVGQHTVRLGVSDTRKESSKEKAVTVDGSLRRSPESTIHIDPEKDPRYPEKRLRIPVKGISYVVGMKGWDMPPVSDEEMAECLAIIKEAGCNGIRIVGDYEDRIIKCAELCVDKFDMVTFSPFS